MRSTSYSHSSERGHPIFRALIVVLGVLIGLPAGFTYYVLSKSLRNQNVCHIGPVRVTPNAAVRDVENWWDHREKLLQLYGTYTTFDDASYYFAKTPYDIQPLCLPAFGWWSITTLSLTLLSPKTRQARQLYFRRTGDSYHVRTSPAIQWDQSHRIKDAPKFSSNKHSSPTIDGVQSIRKILDNINKKMIRREMTDKTNSRKLCLVKRRCNLSSQLKQHQKNFSEFVLHHKHRFSVMATKPLTL